MYNSLFQKEWWLDAVAPGKWGAVIVRRGDEVAARLPYIMEKKFGFIVLQQPPLTPTLGPWLRNTEARPSKTLSIQKELIWELLELMPRYDYFSQNLNPSISSWLPFYWKGFEQTTRYTYIIEDLTDLEKIWNAFSEHARRNIRKAQKALTISTDSDIEEFLYLNEKTFERQGKPLPYSRDFIKRMDAACLHQKARRIFLAKDNNGRTHAAVYILWDKESAYYLMGGEDPALRNSEAGSLLMWEAIKFAATVTKRFDFEGSMIQSVEKFFRGFGGKQTPYHKITSASKRMRVLMNGRDFIRSMRR